MNPSRVLSRDPSAHITSAGLLVAAVVFGLISENAAFGLNNPRRWVPDFLVGVALTGFGLVALRLQRGMGALLVAAGLTWWLGNLVPMFLYFHRGLMLHSVSTYPGLRTRTSAGTSLLALGYLFASWVPLATTDIGTALFGLVVTAVASALLHRGLIIVANPEQGSGDIVVSRKNASAAFIAALSSSHEISRRSPTVTPTFGDEGVMGFGRAAPFRLDGTINPRRPARGPES